MKRNWLRRMVRTLPCVLALYAFASSDALAMCSSTSFGAGAAVTCNQTSDLVILSQSGGLWYHTGAAIGTGPYDWDSGIAGEQSIASGGIIEVTFSAGGGRLKIGNDAAPVDALIGTVTIKNTIVADTQVFLDALTSTSPSTYTIDDNIPAVTKVNQLNFYDSDSLGLSLLVRTGTAADTVNVLSVYGNNTLYIEGNDSVDQVNIGNAGSVQSILGAIEISDAFAPIAITIDDHADATARTATVTSTGVVGLAPAPIHWNEDQIGAVVLKMGIEDDTVNVRSISNTLGATSLTIDGSIGVDDVNIGDSGILHAIEAPVAIESMSGLAAVTIDDSLDGITRSATYSSTGISGLSPGPITWVSSDLYSVTAYFGSANNIVHVLGSPGNMSFVVYSTLNLGNGNDVCYISGSGLGENSINIINGGSGDDRFVISAAPQTVAEIVLNGGQEALGDEIVYTSGTATGAIAGNGTLLPTNSEAHLIDYTSIELFSVNDVIFIGDFE